MFQKCARALPPVFGECKNKQWRAIWARRDVFANGPSASSARNLGKDRFSHPSQNCAANLLGRISQTPLPPPPPPSARQFSNYGAEPWEESVGGGGGRTWGRMADPPLGSPPKAQRGKKSKLHAKANTLWKHRNRSSTNHARNACTFPLSIARNRPPPPTPPLRFREGKAPNPQRSNARG